MISVIILIVLIQSWPAVVSAETDNPEDVVYYTESGHAEFTSRVPLHTFTGESRNLVGMIDLQKNVIDFYLDLSTLETGISRRDRDMFRTLDVDEFPFAEFSGTLDSGFDYQSPEKQSVVTRGEFKIHGVTQDVSIEGTLQMQGENLYLEAEWTLMLEDYDIEPPGILFYRVNDEQELRIEVTLSPHSRDILSTGN